MLARSLAKFSDTCHWRCDWSDDGMQRRVFERGQATVMFAISAVALCGMCALSLDAGRAYVLVQQLKNAANAAALSGGQDLPGNTAQAITDATSVAEQNGIANGNAQVSISSNNTVITVTTTGSVKYYFASLFGIDSGTFSQTSSVEVGPTSQLQGAVPLGVVNQSFVYGQTYTLKASAGEGETGNYGALSFSGSNEGASQYEQYLASGYPSTLTVGESILTKPGNMVGPTDQGLNQRIQSDPTSTYQTALPSSPRVLYVPVITQPGNGRSTVQIVGFAAFFLQSVCNGNVTGQFLHMSVDGQFGTAQDYGLEAERLVE
jgi:Flp pilus assembly protein TadG